MLSLCLSQRVNQVQKESEDTPAVLVDPYVFPYLFIDISIQVIKNADDRDLGISYQTCGKVSEKNSGYRAQVRSFFFTCFQGPFGFRGEYGEKGIPGYPGARVRANG